MPRKDDKPLLIELHRLAHEAKRQRVESLPRPIPPGWHPPMELALPVLSDDEPTLIMKRLLADRLSNTKTTPGVLAKIAYAAKRRAGGTTWFQIDEKLGDGFSRDLRTGGRLATQFKEAQKQVQEMKRFFEARKPRS